MPNARPYLVDNLWHPGKCGQDTCGYGKTLRTYQSKNDRRNQKPPRQQRPSGRRDKETSPIHYRIALIESDTRVLLFLGHSHNPVSRARKHLLIAGELFHLGQRPRPQHRQVIRRRPLDQRGLATFSWSIALRIDRPVIDHARATLFDWDAIRRRSLSNSCLGLTDITRPRRIPWLNAVVMLIRRRLLSCHVQNLCLTTRHELPLCYISNRKRQQTAAEIETNSYVAQPSPLSPLRPSPSAWPTKPRYRSDNQPLPNQGRFPKEPSPQPSAVPLRLALRPDPQTSLSLGRPPLPQSSLKVVGTVPMAWLTTNRPVGRKGHPNRPRPAHNVQIRRRTVPTHRYLAVQRDNGDAAW